MLESVIQTQTIHDYSPFENTDEYWNDREVSTESWYKAGRDYETQGLMYQAKYYYSLSLEFGQNMAQSYKRLARMRALKGMINEALFVLDRAREVSKNRFIRWSDYNVVLSRIPQRLVTDITFTALLEPEKLSDFDINQQDAKFWILLGVLFLHEEFYEEALEMFDKALELDTDSYNALYGKLLTMHRMGVVNEKLVVLKQLRKLYNVF